MINETFNTKSTIVEMNGSTTHELMSMRNDLARMSDEMAEIKSMLKSLLDTTKHNKNIAEQSTGRKKNSMVLHSQPNSLD